MNDPLDTTPTNICECECHGDHDITHFMDCCDMTYMKYIKNGTVDVEEWKRQKHHQLITKRPSK